MAGGKPPDDPVDALLGTLCKDYGAGSVRRLGDTEPVPVDVVPTGSVVLDEALGVGGLPRGRIIECFGPESSGKTSLALHAVAQAQARDLTCAFIDAEHAFDPAWADTLGVDTDTLLLSQPDNGEQALSIAEKLCQSGLIGVLVIDSVAALVPKAELEGEMGDSHVGLHARLMSQALRKLTGTAAAGKTTVVFINQLREKVGILFGSPETTTGGKALKFYASVRLDVRRVATLKDGGEAVGSRVRVKVVKNKVARPFGTAEFDFLFSQGISAEGELLDLGTERGVITKAGAWYTHDGQQLGQGREKARQALAADPDLRAAVETAVRAARPAAPPAPRRRGSVEISGTPPWET